MTLDQFESTLSQQYRLVCCVDLADVNQSHSAIYKIFDQYHKTVFDPDERLIFYSAHQPSDQLLEHIKRAARLIDISDWFIMICAPYQVESKMLLPDRLLNENTLCPLPWMHLAVMNRGEAKACCVYKNNMDSILNNSLATIFYGQGMEQLRQELLQGKRPTGCDHCWNLEQQQIKSNRQWHLDFYNTRFYTSWIDDPQIRSVDFRPGNVCNFKCRICGPDASSQVMYERLRFSTNLNEIQDIKKINGQWFDQDSRFIEQLLSLLPQLINIDLYGGEPFLLKQLPKFLKQAVDSGHASHIRLHFNTNGSVFPTQLVQYLRQFQQVDISVSIDNVGKRFEFERGGEWSAVEQNITQFRAEPNFNVSIMPTINIQNVFYIEDLITWADQTQNRIIFNYLDIPEHLNIDHMTPVAKQLVVSRYHNHPHSELQKIVNRIQNSPGSDGIKFVDFMKQLDRQRKENFSDSHQEIALAMGYSV
jgi:sulfatase maturation enzyme AslB (radical SAM superfamily)